MTISSHCMCHPELEASKLVLRDPHHGDVREHRHTYINNFITDTDLECLRDLEAVMLGKEMWQVDFVVAV